MAYINIKICNSVQAIKYILKYIYIKSNHTILKLDINPHKIA